MPVVPYAWLGGLVIFRTPPTFIPGMPNFQHSSTLRPESVTFDSVGFDRKLLDTGDTVYLIVTVELFPMTFPQPLVTSSIFTPPSRFCGDLTTKKKKKHFRIYWTHNIEHSYYLLTALSNFGFFFALDESKTPGNVSSSDSSCFSINDVVKLNIFY